MSRWFRHYAGMMRDDKLVRVAVKSGQPVERVLWVWGAILESASEVNDGGRFDFDADEAAYFLRCDASDIGSIVAGLEGSGRLVQGLVAKWGDRQFDSDSSRERQRRYRERRNGDASIPKGSGDDKARDGQVTSPDAAVTLQETETETETEKKKDTAACAAPDRFPEFWAIYPKRDGDNPKKPAKLSFERAVRKGENPDAIIAGVKALAAKHPLPTSFVPQAVTWLNQERWKDIEHATGPPNGAMKFRTVEEIFASVAGDEDGSEAVSRH